MDSTGRSGIITGGSSGTGFTIVNMLAETGATIYAVSRTGQPKDAGKSHEGVTHVAVDVNDYGEMESLIKKTGESKGIDFFINNVGITVKCRVENFDDSDFERIMKVNVSSTFKLSCLCHPYLKESAGRGRIVNITPMAAHLGLSEVVLYCTSEGAVLSMIRSLVVEWPGDNINVNFIAPGWFPSKMSQQVMNVERRAKILSRTPVYKFGDTRDTVEMAKYLVSDSAGYTTGQNFVVDGGVLVFGL